MHTAPAHLESKLRFWDFTVGQIAAAFVGIMLGFVWARFVSPLHGMLGAMSGAYIAALPVIPVFVASQTEFDLAGLVDQRGALATARGPLRARRRTERERLRAVGRARRDRPGRRRARARSAGAVGSTGGEAMIAGRTAKSRAGGLPETGELAAVEAIDRTGLIVTSEGAFVRILRVTPPNPLLMSAQEREKTAGTFQRLVSQLKAEETLQFYIDARPVNLTELLAGCRREVQASAGPAPASDRPARDPLALARWRLYAAMEESLRLHADDQAATEISAYVVVPFLPRQSVARAALAWAQRRRLPTAPLERPLQAHRRAVREHLAHVDALRSELEAEGMPTGLLDGEEVVRLLWARFNPTKADKGRRDPELGRRAARRARRPERPGRAPARRRSG